MKYLFTIAITLMFLGCIQKQNEKPKNRDTAYSVRVQGVNKDIKIDSITPIKELIPRLLREQKLYNTGKAYWIGYNDLMYSIAVHSDSAIQPLLNFIDTTYSYKAKFAAIYTIHLIGIDCKIAGREIEEFKNIKAREALLNLLVKDDKLRMEIMRLLIRDPRESDIPKLFNILESSPMDCWQITSGLLRYDLKNIPFDQKVPENLLSKRITFKDTIYFPDTKMFRKIINRFTGKYNDFIKVEDTLINYNYQIPTCIGINDKRVTLTYLIWTCTLTDYCDLGPNFQYIYKNSKIYFCSAATTKKLWINWWKSQSAAYKDSLKDSYKKCHRIKSIN
jgi:hypothetical protein